MTSPLAAQTAGPWRSLIDARATGWRGYQKAGLPDGWKVVDDALTRVAAGGDIVYGAEAFGDFELEFEWKVGPKGNSGVFYRAGEATARIYENAAEYQVLDNIGHPDNTTELTVAGANYALYPAPRDAVKPVGEWNVARIVARGAHVEHWLNGRKVVEFELWSPDWERRMKASKFVEWPTYARASRGFIGLQDHGDWVAFRNMRIRTFGVGRG
ncbi:MAG: DUF1080 domain-containing protein [Gemmatimonadaceae bacterium]|nr:DUF1080 domain-containing protein [Gemmatimonadaceae bacterium]